MKPILCLLHHYHHLSFAGFMILYSHFFACLHLHVSLIHTVNTYHKHIIWLDITVTSLVSDSRNMTGWNESPSLDIKVTSLSSLKLSTHVFDFLPWFLEDADGNPLCIKCLAQIIPTAIQSRDETRGFLVRGYHQHVFCQRHPGFWWFWCFWSGKSRKQTDKLWDLDGIKYWQCILYRCGFMIKPWYVEG